MWYLSVFVPADAVADADVIAASVWPGQPEGSRQLFIHLQDEHGREWVGGNAAVTDAEIAAMQRLVDIPDLLWYRYSTDGLLAMTWPVDQADAGEPWTWERSLECAGLMPLGLLTPSSPI